MPLEKRFIELKLEILRLSIILTFLITIAFLIFHILIYHGDYKYEMVIADVVIIFSSFMTFKYINYFNYKIFAVLEYLAILASITMLCIAYPENYYLPIWMFGTLIVFVLCTDKKIGFIFLIITMIVFDTLYFKKLDIYSLITLNMQFISYFIFGLILIDKLNVLQKKTFIYEHMLYENAIRDSLTNIFNRDYFFKTVELLLDKAKREKNKVLFLIIDIDYFKKINDTFGHPIGDLVLQNVVNVIKNNLRESDLFARIGGEEFGVFIEGKNINPIEIAEKLRKAVENLKIEVDEQFINPTISIGGVLTDKYYNIEFLYKEADEALYEAKKERNKAVIYEI